MSTINLTLRITLILGKRLTLFRNFPNVGKSADLTIYCLAAVLEDWVKRHKGMFPEEFHIQFDGGSENANKYVLAFLEHLVTKRLVRRVFFTRLPVGHTHEDIDQTFSVISRHLVDKVIISPDDFKRELIEAFRGNTIIVKVKDIFVIPNYQDFYQPYIDNKFKKAHKLEHTKLRWRFEAIPPDEFFPNGSKNTFRTHSNEKVIEIYKKDKLECMNRLGQLTGLEPRTSFCRWEPAIDAIENREVEGFYLLNRIPKYDVSLVHPIPPKFFDASSVNYVIDFMNSSIRKKFSMKDQRAIIWEKWFTDYFPKNDNALEYIETHPYHIPLKTYFSESYQHFYSWELIKSQPSEQPLVDFEWPTLVQVSTASVEWQFQPSAPPPRVIINMEEFQKSSLVQYQNDSKPYYEEFLSKLTVPLIKEIIKRKMDQSGVGLPVYGNKKELVQLIKNSDIHVLSARYRVLDKKIVTLVDTFLTLSDTLEDRNSKVTEIMENNDVVAVCVLKNDLQSFETQSNLNETVILAFMYLFQKRDDLMCKAFNSVNAHLNHFSPRIPSLFLKPNFYKTYIKGNKTINNDTNDLEIKSLLNNNSLYRIYIPIINDDCTHALLVINKYNKTMNYLNFKGIYIILHNSHHYILLYRIAKYNMQTYSIDL